MEQLASDNLQLYFGVRLAERPYERIAVNNVKATKKTIELKLDAQEMLNNLNKELGKLVSHFSCLRAILSDFLL